MWHHHSFSGHCTPLDPWNIEPDFRPCYQLELMTLFLQAFSTFERQVLTFRFIKGNVIYKKDVLNLVHFVCVYMLLWRVSKMLNPRDSLFVCRLNGWGRHPAASAFSPSSAAATDGPGKAPEATRRSTWPCLEARWRLRSFCWAKELGWTPRTTTVWGPPVGTRVRNAVSNLGYPQKMLGSVLTGNMSIKYRVNLETRWFFFAFKAAAQRIWIRIECPSPVLDAKFSSGMAWAPSFDQLILLHKAFIRVWSSWGQQRKPESKFGFSLWRSRKVPFREWRETQVQSQTGFQ